MEVPGMRGLFLVLVGSVLVLLLFSSLALIRQHVTPRRPLDPPPRQRRTPVGSQVEEGSAVTTSASSVELSNDTLKVVTPRVKVARNIKVAAEDDVISEDGREGSSRTGGEGGARSEVKSRSRRQDFEGQIGSKVKVSRTKRNGTRSKLNPNRQRVQNGTAVRAKSAQVEKGRQEDRSGQHAEPQTGKNTTSEVIAKAKVKTISKVRSKGDAQIKGKVKSVGAVRRGSSVKVDKNVSVGTRQHRRRRRQSNKGRSKSPLAPVPGPHGNGVDSHQLVFKVNQSSVKIKRPGLVANETQSGMLLASNLSARAATPTSRSATPISRSMMPTSRSATPSSRSATPTSRSATPTSRSATPTSQSATPTFQSATPTFQSATPTSQSATPTFQSGTPTSRSATPTAIVATPTSLDGSASRVNGSAFRPDTRKSGMPAARMDAPISRLGAPISKQDPFISRATTPTSRSSAPTSEPEKSITKLATLGSKSDHPIGGSALEWKRPRWEKPDDKKASYEYRVISSSSKASASNRSAQTQKSGSSVQRNLDSSLIQVPVEQMTMDRHHSKGKATSQSGGGKDEGQVSEQRKTSNGTDSTGRVPKLGMYAEHKVVSHGLTKYNRSHVLAARPQHSQEERNSGLGSEFAIKPQRVPHADVPKSERFHGAHVEKHRGATDTHKSRPVNETDALTSQGAEDTDRRDSQSVRETRVSEPQRVHETDVQRSQPAHKTDTQNSLRFPETNIVDSRRTQETAVSGVLVQGRLAQKPRHAYKPHVSKLGDTFGMSRGAATP